MTGVLVAMGWKSTVLERTDDSVTYRVTRNPSNRLTRRQWLWVIGIFVVPGLLIGPAVPTSWTWASALTLTSAAWLLYFRFRFRSVDQRPAVLPAASESVVEAAPAEVDESLYDRLIESGRSDSFPKRSE